MRLHYLALLATASCYSSVTLSIPGGASRMLQRLGTRGLSTTPQPSLAKAVADGLLRQQQRRNDDQEEAFTIGAWGEAGHPTRLVGGRTDNQLTDVSIPSDPSIKTVTSISSGLVHALAGMHPALGQVLVDEGRRIIAGNAGPIAVHPNWGFKIPNPEDPEKYMELKATVARQHHDLLAKEFKLSKTALLTLSTGTEANGAALTMLRIMAKYLGRHTSNTPGKVLSFTSTREHLAGCYHGNNFDVAAMSDWTPRMDELHKLYGCNAVLPRPPADATPDQVAGYLADIELILQNNPDSIAVILEGFTGSVKPEPWPEGFIAPLIKLIHSYNKWVICDSVMEYLRSGYACGLSRHLGPGDDTPDVITNGKTYDGLPGTTAAIFVLNPDLVEILRKKKFGPGGTSLHSYLSLRLTNEMFKIIENDKVIEQVRTKGKIFNDYARGAFADISGIEFSGSNLLAGISLAHPDGTPYNAAQAQALQDQLLERGVDLTILGADEKGIMIPHGMLTPSYTMGEETFKMAADTIAQAIVDHRRQMTTGERWY